MKVLHSVSGAIGVYWPPPRGAPLSDELPTHAGVAAQFREDTGNQKRVFRPVRPQAYVDLVSQKG